MSPPDRPIAVVIPVFDMADQIATCVALLAAQLDPGDEVVVVDDGSHDDSAERAAAAGARVIANGGASGPYGARNHGAANTDQPFLLFVDARCRARPGLLDAHRALLARDGVALSCTDVAVAEHRSLAGRVAWAQDSFRVAKKIHGSFLDFYPTANLGVTREAFDAVGGFRAIRSGADADLCWRVQRSGCGEIMADARELMTWEPRDRVLALVEQNYRYGRSAVYLERLHAETIAAASPSVPLAAARTVHTGLASPPLDTTSDRVADLGARAINLALRAGRLRGRREHRDVVADDGLRHPSTEIPSPSTTGGPPVTEMSSWQALKADCARYREEPWISRYFWWITEMTIWAVAAYRIGGVVRESLPAPLARPVLLVYDITVMPLVQILTGVELPLQVTVGPGVRIFHGRGLVVGGKAVLGARCVLRQGVNIGHVLGSDTSPTIGDEVDLGAYAQVLGGVTVGDRARIGHSVVFRDIPADATAFGVPARVTSTNAAPSPASSG